MTDSRLCNPSFIRELLSRHNFRSSKSLGQNFLIEHWVPEQIAESAELSEDVGVLEIGPGIGCLTSELANRAGKVVAVELDRKLEPILVETLGGFNNVETVFGDALKLDLPTLVRDALNGYRPVVCANLPYNITSPLLTALIEAKCFDEITVMIQREVAKRICAAPGSSEYGAFTVFVNWHAEPEILFDVPPECFMPAPKVTSSVIRLVPRDAPPISVLDEKLFNRVVRSSFAQRRKTLVNGLDSAFTELTKLQLQAAVSCIGLDLNVRGETLDIATFAALSDQLFLLLINNSD